jgi:hypothetical protein
MQLLYSTNWTFMSLPGRRAAMEYHTSPYHCSLAGTSIHFMHCVPQNLPDCGGEAYFLLSQLHIRLFFSVSRKSWVLQNPWDSGKTLRWVFHRQKEWIDLSCVNYSSPKEWGLLAHSSVRAILRQQAFNTHSGLQLLSLGGPIMHWLRELQSLVAHFFFN